MFFVAQMKKRIAFSNNTCTTYSNIYVHHLNDLFKFNINKAINKLQHTYNGSMANSQVYLLGVIFSADLSLGKHVSNVSATCFYHLSRLRHIRRSLTSESATTLVHAFVTSRVDCNVVFAGAPKIITNMLQQVLNSAARVVSGTQKLDRGLRQLMHTELHWLDVPERVKYKLGVITR